MGLKLTRRKGFNFFRSYYDVYNELENKEDKISFIEALLDRQFLGVKPMNLKGMAKFAYISQTNSIDSQVKGFEDKTGIILTPTAGGSVGGSVTPAVQVEEKVEVKDINPNLSVDWEKLKNNFNQLTGKKTKVVSTKVKSQINARLKEGYTKQDLWDAIVNCFNDPYHKENPKYLTLEFISRSDKIEKYFGEIKKPKTKEDRL
jgi:uncharacterized phage protein (TIGR02220 family)